MPNNGFKNLPPTASINKLPTILYHATLKKNKNNIIKYGLIPKSNSKLSNHPDRIYLTDNYKMSYLFGFNFNEPFIILEIDTNNLNIELYRDINAVNNSYYTLDNIKKQKIRIIYDSLK
jgi:RNA:NAD 2'-phosphotransferase (TPT1/KptA family)